MQCSMMRSTGTRTLKVGVLFEKLTYWSGKQDMGQMISHLNPVRWKVFQCLLLEGKLIPALLLKIPWLKFCLQVRTRVKRLCEMPRNPARSQGLAKQL